jgi:hypothetical protein
VLTAIPTPTPTPGFDPNQVGPGIWGFVLTLAVIVAVILLIIDMVRRIRRVNYRAQVRQQLADEEAQRTAAEDETR